MKNLSFLSVSFLIGLFTGCGLTPIEWDDTMLDGPVVNDTSLTDMTFRVSSHPNRATFDRARPVIICVHGYGACTYEWEEFRDYAAVDGRVYTSLVLLGGHGRDIQDLENTTWRDWQAPIMAEYDSLVNLGFTHLSFAGSSTGASFLLEYFSRNAFNGKSVLPEECILIDPIIIPANKTLNIVDLVGPTMGNFPLKLENDAQKRHWYTNRPASTLSQLNDVIEVVRSKLEKGITLPAGSKAKVYKSTNDDSADPASALLIYKGCTDHDGNKIEVEMVDSDLHVFTRLHARVTVSHADSLLQVKTFKEMIDRVVAR
jgi:carboxylesterase